jgi:hypothetical protein
MPRKPKEQSQAEQDPFEVDANVVDADNLNASQPVIPLVPESRENPSSFTAPVIAPISATAPLAALQIVKTYRVRNGGPIMHRGQMTNLKQGKVIDERFYDVARLREQGIDLEPIPPTP